MDELTHLGLGIMVLEVNPHTLNNESVESYLSRTHQQDNMSAKTFMKMHLANVLVKLSFDYHSSQPTGVVYGLSIEEVINKALKQIK